MTPDLWELSYHPTDTAQETWTHYMPDVAVEIVTADETPEEIAAKVADYLRNGAPVVWVVDSKTYTVTVHTAEGARQVSRFGVLKSEDVMPGSDVPIQLPVKAIFGR